MNIIQTWKELGVPPICIPLVEKTLSVNKNCNHLFFTDEDIIRFIKTQFPEYLDTFISFKYKIQQIDFFRYLAVYHYGGIYLDIDVEINTPLTDLDLSKCYFPIEYKTEDGGFSLGNYAFYSPKNHPFLKHIIDNIVNKNVDNETIKNAYINSPDTDKEYTYVYSTTGPSMVSRCYTIFDNKSEVVLLEPDIFESGCFGNYGKHNEFGFWKNKVNNLFLPMSDK
jgi:mannosyltransferase OCH1-like enzyme